MAAPGAVYSRAAALGLLHQPRQAASLLQSAAAACGSRRDSACAAQNAHDGMQTAGGKMQQEKQRIAGGSVTRCWQALQAVSWLQAGAVQEAERAAAQMPFGLR